LNYFNFISELFRLICSILFYLVRRLARASRLDPALVLIL